MDKTILKNFAIYSRNKLIQEITNKASMVGITEEGIEDPLPESNSDMLMFDIKALDPYIITGKRIKQYERLKEELERRENNSDYDTAYKTLIEEVAYTWFNRLIAIRFMEVNNYIPHKMRVLSSEIEGVNEPEFVTSYMESELDFTEKELEQLANWKLDASASAMENMFRHLFIKQCNALNDNLPELFEKTNDFAELLLTISYNDLDGVLYKLVHDIPEEYFDIETDDGNGQVEIIGWMYQYYNTDRKDEVFARPKSQKISKEDIPAVTQLFTPDWIVRYMVENSLGRLWIEKLLASGEARSEKEIAENFEWKYYIPEAEQDGDVKEQLLEIRKDKKNLKLEDVTFMDPAMGSFHIGVYAFDVFMQLYESQGYTKRDAAKLIIENNLYGIDIDKRAYQLSYFACMMKARQYNKRMLNVKIKSNLYTTVESNNINRKHLDYLGSNIEEKKEWNKVKEDIIEILDIFIDAREYGSILIIEKDYDYNVLREFVKSFDASKQISLEKVGIESTQKEIHQILNMAKVLDKKYDLVVTNPPYLGTGGMNSKLKKYITTNYKDSKSDFFSIFIEKCHELTKKNTYLSMITQPSFLFLSSYEKLRGKLFKVCSINSLLHMGRGIFGVDWGSTAFVIHKANISRYSGVYFRLHERTFQFIASEDICELFLYAKDNEIKYDFKKYDRNLGLQLDKNINESGIQIKHFNNQENFMKIPGKPIVYFLKPVEYESFMLNKIGDYYEAKGGMTTGNNNLFLRLWHEVRFDKIGRGCSLKESTTSKDRWFPYNKGGPFRKWYGNMDYIINWENSGLDLKTYKNQKKKQNPSYNNAIAGLDSMFKPQISWSVFGKYFFQHCGS